MNHKIGDLVWDHLECEIGMIVRIWTKEEIHEQGKDYDDFLYELYFPSSGFDRYQKRTIDEMAEDLALEVKKSK